MAWLAAGGLALAQTAPSPQTPPSEAQGADLQAIVVTSTRIVRPGFTAPTPTTSVDAVQIAASGVNNIADLLDQVPSFRPTITSTSGDSRGFAPGANYADLRGFGATRTLVLVNGERVVPQVPSYSAAITNQVDLGIIPTIAIQRTDVITGGASAAWGSDAVAGVVNLLLYKHYQGIQGQVSGGFSQAGDNHDVNVGLLAGTSFQGDRGHITAAFEYDHNTAVKDIFSRDWGRNAPYVIANPACVGCYVSGTNYQNATTAPGGLITSAGPLKNTAFTAAGQPYPFVLGSFVNGSAMFGGALPGGNSPQAGVYMRPPTLKYSFYSYADYSLTDRLVAHVQVDEAFNEAHNRTGIQNSTFTIKSSNPYIPASVQATMTANNIASFTLADFASDLGRNLETVFNKTGRYSGGVDWDLGNSWKADAYYEYGVNVDTQKFSNLPNFTNMTQAASAVTVNGQIVCSNPANGCAPLNLFGAGNESAAAKAFILTSAFTRIRYTQSVAAANLRGEPFNTWAGPVSIATGFEYRRESQTNTVDGLQSAGAFSGLSNPNFHAQLHISDVYGETVIPVLKGLSWVKELDLNGAIRHSDYSSIGGVTTWKLGATWNVNDDLLIRGTRSRDIRAPNLTELYYPNVQAALQAVPGQATQAAVFNGGNSALQAEVAKSITAGFTYRPHFIPGLQASIDYFDINLANAITVASGVTVLSQCSLGFQSFCGLETISGGAITQIHATFANLSNVLTRGLDLELSYSAPLSRFSGSLPGSMTLRALGTYTGDLTYQLGPGLQSYNHAGQVQAGLLNVSPFWAPNFRASFSANYNLDRFSGTLIANYTSGGVEDTTITTAQFADNHIPSYTKFDLLASYDVLGDKRLQIYGTVNNLFNKDPPIDPSLTLTIPTAPSLYDTIGRTFRIGVRFKH